ncbi:response regulator transcription factor [Auritidibacter ignavus]|uniref:response regulator transcription factor n=1 Tax=Auritidibacter ignavus TaxID=678932 RepID=UPI00244D4F09|nr:response regulator transcription factor [Auritidibacter ignavus]WGH82928.1 response regulator transcription factor [Auritidibacter ignavus]
MRSSEADPTISVLVVDDQPMIRTGLTAMIGTEPRLRLAGEAQHGAEALELVHSLEPDVVCMDVQMPVMDGIEATREITRTAQASSVLILTTFDRDDFLFETLEAGASGFLLKTAGADEIIEAIITLGEGEALLAPEVTRRVLQRFVAQSPSSSTAVNQQTTVNQHGATSSGPTPVALHGAASREVLDELTDRETEVFRMLTQGYSNTQIAEHLVLGRATIKTHVSNLLTKLRVKDRVHAVIWAYEHHL